MADRYGVWLSYNNQREGFELPIMPMVGVNTSGDGAGHDVHGFGKVNIIKARNLQEISIEGLLPAQRYPYITAEVVFEPKVYVDYIMRWWWSRRPIRIVYVGPTMEINTAASIESFEWRETPGAAGDIEYTLQLKEYWFHSARRVKVVQTSSGGTTTQKSKERSSDKQTPKTYTLAAGDSLWKVAQKMLGDGSRWREIQKLNKLSDADLKRLKVGATLKLPPEKR
ncbi:peptidoglycan-binding protein LysM [Paenibacillus cisolokensis]|uniref:Peptidoglycan-binding protein LysM n=1 Tax=Paenibacillus cisolokensis TaxID=1658519 RepID=A0ABQ4N633_9BACL|nr:LysM peptidoglycan-binding domain-containing protein [Paenibacillus cisolokensis]GIQ63643.1 peptidoglycan-binding protein LysM [Paenibacillus cisolokensis]